MIEITNYMFMIPIETKEWERLEAKCKEHNYNPSSLVGSAVLFFLHGVLDLNAMDDPGFHEAHRWVHDEIDDYLAARSKLTAQMIELRTLEKIRKPHTGGD